jgi:hypothetical protein
LLYFFQYYSNPTFILPFDVLLPLRWVKNTAANRESLSASGLALRIAVSSARSVSLHPDGKTLEVEIYGRRHVVALDATTLRETHRMRTAGMPRHTAGAWTTRGPAAGPAHRAADPASGLSPPAAAREPTTQVASRSTPLQ